MAKKRFGLIVPNNLYGQIILDRSISLIKNKESNYVAKLSLSNKQINDKPKLFSILINVLERKKNPDCTKLL